VAAQRHSLHLNQSLTNFALPRNRLSRGKRYATAYNEVKALGASSHSARTQEQTDLALFWNSNFLVLWNRALRDIVGLHVPDIGDSARLFAAGRPGHGRCR